MTDFNNLRKLEITCPKNNGMVVSAAKINVTRPFSPEKLIVLLNADEWETFIQEWAFCKKKYYALVTKMGGANDYGIDVAAFRTERGFEGEWDNYQCKFYSKSLSPSIANPEIGKFLWHIFRGRITTPKNYYFFSPKDCGRDLKNLLLNTSKLKKSVFENWDKQCKTSISTIKETPLVGEFKRFYDSFDFSIFKYKPHISVLSEHRDTPYHTQRFGGGLADRPTTVPPPQDPAIHEANYVKKLFEAYSDCGNQINCQTDLPNHPKFEGHFNRSRQLFYDAESLKNFARDNVPLNTFEDLQDEVYYVVKDIEEDHHETAFKRVKEVTKTASSINVSGNGLSGVTTSKDLQGICHQLANDEKLTWRK